MVYWIMLSQKIGKKRREKNEVRTIFHFVVYSAVRKWRIIFSNTYHYRQDPPDNF